MIKFGTITEIDPDTHRVRVDFVEDDILSPWLPVLVARTTEDSFFALPSIGQHVACHLDENCETGYVAGAIWDAANLPPDAPADTVTGAVFRDGTTVKYDSEAHELTIENTDALTVTVDAGTAVTVKTGTSEVTVEPDGITVKRGGESLSAILSDLITQIMAETHPTAMGPSGPPLNTAAYNAIKLRIPNLLK